MRSLLIFFLMPFVFCATLISQQTPEKFPNKPVPLRVSDEIVVIDENVVTRHWATIKNLVNAPTSMEQVEPGQCVRFAVIASGDDRDAALQSATLRLETSYQQRTEKIEAKSLDAVRKIKPEGGDFVTQALGAAGVQSPELSMVTMGVSAFRWCVPEGTVDGTLSVTGTVALKSGRTISLKSEKVPVVSFEKARTKKKFSNLGDSVGWLQNYHEAPNPGLIFPAMRLAAGDETASKMGSLSTFFVAALRDNPKAAQELAAKLPASDAGTRSYALPILQLAGFDVSALLKDFQPTGERAFKDLKVLSDPYDLTPDAALPQRMDMLWSTFFATGEDRPVRTIVSMLAWREDYDKFQAMVKAGKRPKELSDSIMRAVSYMAAGWSLSAISRNDGTAADYLDLLRESPDTPVAIRTELKNLYTNPAFRKQ